MLEHILIGHILIWQFCKYLFISLLKRIFIYEYTAMQQMTPL